MASHYQALPPLRYQQKFHHDVKPFTQLSINPNDSPPLPPLTSAKLFTCRSHTNTNVNANGILLFPLEQRHETSPKAATKIVWHDLLKYLKSQSIIKNMDVFRKSQKNHIENKDYQTFPLENKNLSIIKNRFPCQTAVQNNFDLQINNKKLQQKSTKKFKSLKFPLKLMAGKNKFVCKNQSVKQHSVNFENVKKQRGWLTKSEKSLENLHNIISLRNDEQQSSKIQRFPCIKRLRETNEKLKFPLQSKAASSLLTVDQEEKQLLKFPIKLLTILGKFPVKAESSKDSPHTEVLNAQFKQKLLTHCPPPHQILNLYNNYEIICENLNNLNKFPCCTTLDYNDLKRFPLFTERKILKFFSNKTSICFSNSEVATSLLMTCKGQHVSQVQNTHLLQTLTCEHKQTPPQTTAFTKTLYDDNNDVYKLPAINAINNTTLSNEVGLFEEKIEYIQGAIVALFDKIQNSFRKTHNVNENDEKTNAINRDDDSNGVARFALTPPTNSTTSVQNNESILSINNNINTNNKDVHNKYIYDLGDLWHNVSAEHGKIVESSDVRDTLAETVDYGGVKNDNQNTTTTGNFLVKSEEPISPPPTLATQPLTVAIATSLERSEILTKHYVLPVNLVLSNDIKNLELNEKIKTQTETEINEKKEISDMTIIRLEDNENNHLPSIESYANDINILVNDREIDEMKYEMHKAKGALQNTFKDSRTVGKHDTLKTGNLNENFNRNRPSRDVSSTSMPALSATQRQTMKSENLHSPSNKYPVPNILNNRSLTASQKTLNTSNDISGNRRPSLSSLRNTQSTSLLSQDLTRYNPSLTTNQQDHKTAINRGVSIDSCLENVLPERTRLRRQRRLRTQGSQDEPEDPIERLNRLKARISASLSEVKGVLKQYSTDGDGETENENLNTATAVNVKELQKEEEEKKEQEGPVTFRFVKKIRRRSIFSEQEEEKETEEEKNQKEVGKIGKDEVDHLYQPADTNSSNTEIQKEQIAKQVINDSDKISNLEINTNLYTLKEENQEYLEETPTQCKEIPNSQVSSKSNDPSGVHTLQALEASTPSLHQIKPTTEHKTHDLNTIENTNEQKPQELVEKTLKGAIPKQSESHISTVKTELTSDAKPKIKKKIIVIKPKDPTRRASLAAVEGSKIEPPLKVAIPAKIIRRPSDSEAVVKKKLITAKINTSGSIEEVTPKTNIIKVKRSSTKSNVQLTTKQTKLIEKDSAVTAINNESIDRVKSTDKQKSINNDRNEDVLMPKEQKNNSATSQTNLLLPTQLVIDETTASLKAKTIENSQLKLNQEQVQKQTQQQATIESTTTKFNSNELQQTCGDGGAMLENRTTNAISLTKAIEPNGQQIKRENKNAQQEDLHDLLQQETTIVKPSTIKLVEQVSENYLEKDRKHIEQQKSLEQQQVDAIVQRDNVSTKKVTEIDETKTSSKEPCAVQTQTSTYIVDHEHHHLSLVESEQSITHKTDTKAISSPHISISSIADSTENTTKTCEQSFKESNETVNQNTNTMPELQLAPAPVQTAEVSPKPEQHKKKIILKKIVRQPSIDKTKTDKTETDVAIVQEANEEATLTVKDDTTTTQEINDLIPQTDESTEEISESTEISESSQGSEEAAAASNDDKPKKERKIKKKVIIKRQKRRLSIGGDSFFHPITPNDETQNAEVETLEKAIAYVSDEDDEADSEDKELDEEAKKES